MTKFLMHYFKWEKHQMNLNGDGIDILSSHIEKSQQQQLFTNYISSTENKIKIQSLPTGPFI